MSTTIYLDGPAGATLELDLDADGMIADVRPAGRGHGHLVGAIVVDHDRLEEGAALRIRRPGGSALTQQWRVAAIEAA